MAAFTQTSGDGKAKSRKSIGVIAALALVTVLGAVWFLNFSGAESDVATAAPPVDEGRPEVPANEAALASSPQPPAAAPVLPGPALPATPPALGATEKVGATGAATSTTSPPSPVAPSPAAPSPAAPSKKAAVSRPKPGKTAPAPAPSPSPTPSGGDPNAAFGGRL